MPMQFGADVLMLAGWSHDESLMLAGWSHDAKIYTVRRYYDELPEDLNIFGRNLIETWYKLAESPAPIFSHQFIIANTSAGYFSLEKFCDFIDVRHHQVLRHVRNYQTGNSGHDQRRNPTPYRMTKRTGWYKARESFTMAGLKQRVLLELAQPYKFIGHNCQHFAKGLFNLIAEHWDTTTFFEISYNEARDYFEDTPDEDDIILAYEADQIIAKGDVELKRENCTAAFKIYQEASEFALFGFKSISSWEGKLAWRMHLAETCIGKNMPRIGTGSIDCGDEIKFLKNEKLASDFQVISQPNSYGRAKHMGAWRELLGVDRNNCTIALVRRAWMEKMLIFHPGKYRGNMQCGHEASIWLSAASELLKETKCGLSMANKDEL